MLRSIFLTLGALAFSIALSAVPVGSAFADGHQMTPEEVEADIWAKEVAIFKGRGRGDLTDYVNVLSRGYLGWPPSLPAPVNGDGLRAMARDASALDGEVIDLVKTGFSMEGNSAVMYFLTHRTRLGQGFAVGEARNVNDYFENIHVWGFEDEEWRLIGGMARLVDGPRGPAANE